MHKAKNAQMMNVILQRARYRVVERQVIDAALTPFWPSALLTNKVATSSLELSYLITTINLYRTFIMVFPKGQGSNNNQSDTENDEAVEAATDNEQANASFICRRQSTGSFTTTTQATTTDTTSALALISDMLGTYNQMIEANTNAIQENAEMQAMNFSLMRSALDSIIDAINGITQRAVNLEAAARTNADNLTTLKEEAIAGNNMILHNRLDDIGRLIDMNAREMVDCKNGADALSESVRIIAGRVGSLENRVSNMERLLMTPRKQNQNDVAAKMA